MSIAISAQGTLIAREDEGLGGGFTTIGELRDITPPALSRNPIETTTHNDSQESFVVGIKRHGDLSFTVGFLPGDASHDEQAGLTKSWNSAQKDQWKITYPDGSIWQFYGYITSIGPSAPVDDGLTADITIRPTGAMTITGS